MNKLLSLSFIVSIIVGSFFAIYGLINLSWSSALPWSGTGAHFRFLTSLSCLFCITFIVIWRTRLSSYVVGGLLIVVMSLFSGNLWPLFVVLWLFLSSFLMGKMILNFFDEADDSGDTSILKLLVGLGFYGSVIGLLAHFSFGYPSVYFLLLLLPVLLKYLECKKIFQKITGIAKARQTSHVPGLFLDCVIVSLGLIYVLVSFMPELGFDALAMHLFIPVQIYSKHKWSFDAVTYVWATTPMLGDWIFSLPYMLAGEFGSRMLLIGFIFIIAELIRLFCLWAGGSGAGSRWAVLIYLSTPLTFALGSTLFIDAVWTAFLIAGIYVFYKFCFESSLEGPGLYTAGLLLGYSAASKAVTLSLLPILMVIMVIKYKTWSKSINTSKIFLAFVLFFLAGCSPYLTAWFYTGNPVFPFFNAIFKSTYYPFINFDSAAVFGRGVRWDTIYKTVFESGKYFEAGPGAPGFQWLILLIPIFFLLLLEGRRRGLLVLFTCVAIVVSVFQSVSYLRYAFPAWVLLASAAGIATSSSSRCAPLLNKILVLAGGLVVILNLIFFTAGSFYRDFSWQSIFDRPNGGSYIVDRLPMRKAVQIVNELNLSKSPVAVFGSPLAAGLLSDALYPNWYNNRFQSAVASSKSDQDLANLLIGYGVEFIILEANWNGAGCCGNGAQMQKRVEDITIKISDLGLVSVRKLDDRFYFQRELLVNPELKGGLGWSAAPGVRYDKSNGAMIVDINSSASQAVTVNPGVKYRNSVVARCYGGAGTGRVQINWLDAKGVFLGASIKTFDCLPNWTESSMDVIAPKEARTGIVYVVGHGNVPLEYQRSSLKQ